MTRRVYCFRCDWAGDTSSRTCPRCGAALYRESAPVDPRTTRRRDPRGAPDVPDGDLPPESGSPGPRRALGRTLRSLGALAAIVVVAALALDRLASPSQRETRPSGATAPATASPVVAAPSGRLVYLGQGDPQHPLLSIFDLQGRVVASGPRLPGLPVELVDASGAERGWIGVEVPERDGSIAALVLDGVASEASARRLAGGDVVAWGPSGTTVVLARNGSAHRACPSALIEVVSVRTGAVSSGVAAGAICGPISSLGRSAAANYFSARTDAGFGLYVTGTVGVPHLLFGGVRLLSSSAVSAFLLEPQTGPGRSSEPETILRWRGTGGPVRFELDGDPLVVDRVLAWSHDGLEAAVLGTVGFRKGVYLLDVVPGRGPRSPVFVTRASNADATFASDGSLYVVAHRRILWFADGAIVEMTLPAGAPDPTGPILWVP